MPYSNCIPSSSFFFDSIRRLYRVNTQSKRSPILAIFFCRISDLLGTTKDKSMPVCRLNGRDLITVRLRSREWRKQVNATGCQIPDYLLAPPEGRICQSATSLAVFLFKARNSRRALCSINRREFRANCDDFTMHYH